MKQKYLFIFLAVLSAVFACEQVDESALGEKETVEMVPMTFTAVIEKDAKTKTVLGDEVTTDNVTVKKLLWQPGDEIGVSPIINVAEMMPSLSKFTATLSSPSATTEFEGSVEFAQRYMAFYPYQESLWTMGNSYMFYFPEVQKYVEGSFDPDAAPMVAVADIGNDFEFKNLCGIVAFQLKGTEAIKSITFSGTDIDGNKIPLSGHFSVNPITDEPQMYASMDVQGHTMTLDCVEPVQLNETTATPFYMMLPPATYANFTLIITTADGEIMMKSGSNLTITRSHLKPTAELEYMESVYMDLSAHGTANSYIVKEAGLYSFKANVVGNGAYGYVDGEKFYPVTPDISPTKVKLLWEEKEGTITNLNIKDGKVVFMATGQEGNVFVAVTDDSDTILWSWHLWMTDQPQEQTYVNDKGTFYVLDRNIGAISAERGSTDQDRYNSMGLLYQWGRKDPFRNNIEPEYLRAQLYMEEVAQMPTVRVTENSRWLKDEQWTNYLWTSDVKTIYDPCPPGYLVATKEIWYGFTQNGVYADRRNKINAYGSFDKGWNFYYDGINTTWYPVTNFLEWGNWINYSSDRGIVWSGDNSWGDAFVLDFQYSSDMECTVYNIDRTASPMYGHPVRCMKDTNHETTKVPQVKYDGTSDVTTTSITLNGKITSDGWGNIKDKGFVWGTDPSLGDGQQVSCGSGSEDFSINLTDLTPGGVYYLKVYAQNDYDYTYSDIYRFSIRYSDDVENLSSEETANCYMVKPVAGTYSFDASVKGNSTAEISPVSADIVWEVDGNRNINDNIIDNVRLSDGLILFELPADVQSGNALIAAKDANGTIIWSWHIWVADFDPIATQIHNNAATFMDRNLGAVVNAPDNNDFEGTWASAYGTIYQWGRKDPLIRALMTPNRYSAFTSVEEASANPTTFAASSPWLSPFVSDLWTSEKTMYDPCPIGWKVPSHEDINSGWGCSESYAYGAIIYVNDTMPETWFGFGDFIHSGGEYYSNMGYGYYWTTSYQSNYNNVMAFYVSGGMGSSNMSPTDAYPIRCMKDE